MSALVIADHDNQSLKQSTLNAVATAQQLSSEITVLVAGSECDSVAKESSSINGVQEVWVADQPAYAHALPENIAPLVVDLAANFDFIVTAHTTTGKNFLPRAAALLDVQMISDIIEVVSPDTFKRPIYAGSAIETVKTSDSKVVLSVRATAFDAVDAESGSATITHIDQNYDLQISAHVEDKMTEMERPELPAARIVVSGGRGMREGENFKMLEELADVLGAAVGASRAAVDAGFVPNDMQVGQTGKIVAPDLYIAIGISGAIQHLAGMKDSKVIVAINKDLDAPIFQLADYGLVEDLFTAVPELIRLLRD